MLAHAPRQRAPQLIADVGRTRMATERNVNNPRAAFLVAFTAVAWHRASTAASRPPTVENVVGCYAVSKTPWAPPWGTADESRMFAPPSAIQLTTDAIVRGGYPFFAIVTGPGATIPDKRFTRGVWRIVDGRVELSWWAKVVGMSFSTSPDGEFLEGSGETRSDAGAPCCKSDIVLHRVPCVGEHPGAR